MSGQDLLEDGRRRAADGGGTAPGRHAARTTPSRERELLIQRYEGRDAVLGTHGALRSAGLLPPPLAEMDPEYLAAGFEGDRPGTIVAYDGGRPVGYMSYVLRRISFRPRAGRIRLGGFPCRQLRIFAYVAAAEAPRRVLDDFFELLLQRRTWDVAQIFDLPVTNPLAEYVMERSLLGDRCSVVGRTFETYQVGIAESFDIYLRDNFTKKTRYNLKREVRLFQEATGGQAAFKPYSSADRAREFLEGAEHALKRSHRWRDRPHIGPTPMWLRKIAHLADRGQFRGYLLSVGDTPIAFCYGEMRWGELSIEIAGHDEQFARLNPGKVLLYRMLEELHASQAARRLNLGTTTAEHRRVFAASSRCMLDVTAYPYGAYPQVLRALARTADAGYRGLRTVARKWMPHIKRRARAASPLALAGVLDLPGLLLQ